MWREGAILGFVRKHVFLKGIAVALKKPWEPAQLPFNSLGKHTVSRDSIVKLQGTDQIIENEFRLRLCSAPDHSGAIAI